MKHIYNKMEFMIHWLLGAPRMSISNFEKSSILLPHTCLQKKNKCIVLMSMKPFTEIVKLMIIGQEFKP